MGNSDTAENRRKQGNCTITYNMYWFLTPTPSATKLFIEIRKSPFYYQYHFKYELELSRDIDLYYTACLIGSFVNLVLPI